MRAFGNVGMNLLFFQIHFRRNKFISKFKKRKLKGIRLLGSKVILILNAQSDLLI